MGIYYPRLPQRENRNVPSLLEIRNLQLEFRSDQHCVRVVDGVSLAVGRGETLGLVGESGSGKSVTALSIGRLLRSPPAFYAGGEIFLDGRDVLKASKRELQSLRGRGVGYIFQEPGASLNPVLRIGAQIKESLTLHRRQAATDAEVVRLLKWVGIPAPETRAKSYPHEMSGGMQQRVMIAMALAAEPKLLVADEPTTALDVTIQAQILALLKDVQQRLGMSLLLITHNLGIVGQMADRVAVMYAGQIVETAPARELLRRPLHPYTRALMNAAPRLGGAGGRLANIPGSVPRPGAMPSGCRFHPRCAMARADCSVNEPALAAVENGRQVRCPYWNSP
jgi:oligopeptide/dipeptide ABC transporter ATP-binding protein